MDRRSFLTAGTGLVAAGAAATAALTSNSNAALAAGSATTPTVYNFGAVGDGYTDDSAAFSKALAWAASNGQMVVVPAGKYGIANTISWGSGSINVGSPWGFAAQGATLVSRITNGADVMFLQAQNTSDIRYFRIVGGMEIMGTGSDGNGLHIQGLSGNSGFYNFVIEGLTVVGCKNGLFLDGNVFECNINSCFFMDLKQDGIELANNGAGICSTININNCYFSQNGRYGLYTFDVHNQYGGPYDVRITGGYARNNQSFAFYFNNGNSGAVTNVGFENNCMSKKPGDPSGGHVYGGVHVNMRDCVGFAMYTGATYLVQGYFMQSSILDNCTNWSGGATAAAGPVKLVNINGQSGGAVLMTNSNGGFDGAHGSGVKWIAANCTGPSAWGNLNPIGTMSGTF